MNVLLLTFAHPLDRSFGGGQRNYLVWKSLTSVGCVTTLILGKKQENLFPACVGPHEFINVNAVVRNGFSALLPNVALTETVAAALMGRYFHIGVARYLSLGIVLAKTSIPKVILDADDLQKNNTQQGICFPSEVFVNIKESLRRRIALGIARKFDDVWCVTKKDAILVGANSDWLPNSIGIPQESWTFADRSKDILLTVGDFTYEPNVQGITWFIEKVWPLLQESRPPDSIALNVVGRMPPHLRMNLERHTGVTTKGYVQNLSDEFLHSSLFFSGVHSGAGSQVKIIEAMSYGCPVVCHEYARDGFDGVSVEAISGSFANSPSDWVKRISLILDDSVFAMKLGRSSRKLVAERYSAASFQKKAQERLHLLGAHVRP